MPDLAPADVLGERHEKARSTQVSVVLWNLVLEDHVIPERVPDELGHGAVVLMGVVARGGEDQIRERAAASSSRTRS